MADPNWLLSAALQSGAALIAILGGFIASRYVAVDTQSLAARYELSQARDREIAQRGQHAHARTQWLNSEIEALTFDWELLKDAHDDPDAFADHGAVDIYPRIPRELHILAGNADDLAAAVKRTAQWLALYASPAGRATAHSPWPEAAVRLFGLFDNNAARHHVEFEISSETTTFVNTVLVPAQARRESTASKLVEAEEEHRAARLEAYRHGATPGLGLSLEVLLVAGALTIAPPLVLLTLAPLELCLWVRITTAALFLAGVGLVGLYLAVYAQYLSSWWRRDQLPRHLWGLFWGHGRQRDAKPS